MISLNVNGQEQRVDVDPEMPLLWVLRDVIGLTGSKYGCGIAQCGACVVLVDGDAIPSCQLAVSAAAGRRIVTIEGLSGRVATAVQQSWVALDVPQCGYCQSGQVIAAVALLSVKPQPSDAEIADAMNPYLCRCATYHRIRAGVRAAAERLA